MKYEEMKEKINMIDKLRLELHKLNILSKAKGVHRIRVIVDNSVKDADYYTENSKTKDINLQSVNLDANITANLKLLATLRMQYIRSLLEQLEKE